MANPLTAPYHMGPQSAVALLRPIEASLAELEARLTQYVERIPMPDTDREAVARARELIAQDRARVASLIAEST